MAKFSDNLNMEGRLVIQKWQNGRLAKENLAKNMIVNSGRRMVAQIFTGEPISPVSHLAVGVGEDGVVGNDLGLRREVFRKPLKPVELTKDLTMNEDGRSRLILSMDLEPHEANGEVLTEAGLFNSSNPEESIMYNRVVFPPISKTKDFKLTLIWEILF